MRKGSLVTPLRSNANHAESVRGSVLTYRRHLLPSGYFTIEFGPWFLAIAILVSVGLGEPASASPHANSSQTTLSDTLCPSAIRLLATIGYESVTDASLELASAPAPSTIPAHEAERHPALPKAPPSCDIALYRSGDPLDIGNTEITLSANVSSLEFAYKITEREMLRSENQFNGLDLFSDDNVSVVFARQRGRGTVPYFVATVNPSGNCTAVTTNLIVRFSGSTCSVSKAAEKSSATGSSWSGTLSIPLSALKPSLEVPLRFYVFKTHWPPKALQRKAETLNSYSTSLQYISLQLTEKASGARSDRYIAGAQDFGHITGAPPHRTNILGYYAFDPHSAVGAAFSDNAKPLNAIRDAEIKQVFAADQYKALGCIACGSFENVAPTAFDRTITSANTFGSDFSNLGFDSVPFSYASINYPLDSEYGIAAFDQAVAGATFNGTTQKNGLARDTVFRGSQTFQFAPLKAAPVELQVSAFQVNSSRSVTSEPKVGSYDGFSVLSNHTTNSELSAAIRATTSAKLSLEESLESTRPVIEVDAIARYGTQYLGADSSRHDAGVTVTRQHPLAFSGDRIGILADVAYTLGYRNVGDFYKPNVGTSDPTRGLHGFFTQITNSISAPGQKKPVLISLSGYRFGDAIEARNEAVTGSLSVPLSIAPCPGPAAQSQDSPPATAQRKTSCLLPHLAVVGSGTIKHLAQSLVSTSFAQPFVIPEDRGGGAYLSNGSYSSSLAYTNGSGALNVSVGFTAGDDVTCDTTAKRLPCYAYRENGLLFNVYASYGRWLMGALTEKKTDDDSHDLVELAGTKSLVAAAQPIVENRIVRSAGLAAMLPGVLSCSSATLTLSNQSAPIESFIASAPQPGFTTTYGIDTVMANVPATLFAGFSRTSLPLPASQFILRLRFGLPARNFSATTMANCSSRTA